MPSPTTLVAGAGADDASVGTTSWASTANITAVDGVFATNGGGAGSVSHYLKSSTYGFSISGSTSIDGIFAEILVKSSQTNSKDTSVKIIKGGTIGGTDKATSTVISTTLTWIGYGGSTDKWGLTWTESDINSTGFGFAYSFSVTGISDSISVDAMRITVYYTIGDTFGPELVAAASQTMRTNPPPRTSAPRGGDYSLINGVPIPNYVDDPNDINSRVMIWNP